MAQLAFYFTCMTGTMAVCQPIARMSAKVPQRRLGTVDDLNGALIFLASDACRYTQGQIILCDGGLLLLLALAKNNSKKSRNHRLLFVFFV